MNFRINAYTACCFSSWLVRPRIPSTGRSLMKTNFSTVDIHMQNLVVVSFPVNCPRLPGNCIGGTLTFEPAVATIDRSIFPPCTDTDADSAFFLRVSHWGSEPRILLEYPFPPAHKPRFYHCSLSGLTVLTNFPSVIVPPVRENRWTHPNLVVNRRGFRAIHGSCGITFWNG